ncbi:MAG: HEPN domain-containing protein [Ignavibacteriaceae bacterium]|nr:HEPN domain-containing protein [Ignavibacteriaceae bacterium]
MDNGKILYGLFFCHLSIEKLLKSHYVRCTNSLAPKTHDLLYLSRSLDFELDAGQIAFFATLMYYQLVGRYPENLPETPAKEKAQEYLNKTKEIFEWLAGK